MTTKPDPITLPCVCHVPPPEGTVRLELRPAKQHEPYWSDSLGAWCTALVNFSSKVPVAILAPQYDYPTPVEACRLLAEVGKHIDCEYWSAGVEWRKGKCQFVELEPDAGDDFLFCIKNVGWTDKIRIPKRG